MISGGVPSRGGSTDPDLARADYVGEINGLLESTRTDCVAG